MKTLIIPDIHTKFQIAESIIKSESPDSIVFLGDYFDAFNETEQDTHNTARWLATSLQQQNRIHLIGNHDLPYMADNPVFLCSGFSESKKYIINLYDIPWNKMHTYCYVGDHLCTHAGVSKQFFEEHSTDTLNEFMKQSTEDLKHIDDVNYLQKFFRAGVLRGGVHKNGGIVWCDYNEFTDIPHIKQIFGHTRATNVRQNKNHICLDTELHNYIIHQDSTLIVKEI